MEIFVAKNKCEKVIALSFSPIDKLQSD